MLELIVQLVAAITGTLVSTSLFLLAYRIWKCDKNDYEENRRIAKGLKKGKVGDQGDWRIKKGLVIDLKTNELKATGKLSDEALNRTIN